MYDAKAVQLRGSTCFVCALDLSSDKLTWRTSLLVGWPSDKSESRLTTSLEKGCELASNWKYTSGLSRQVPALPDRAELARSFRVEGWNGGGLEAVIEVPFCE